MRKSGCVKLRTTSHFSLIYVFFLTLVKEKHLTNLEVFWTLIETNFNMTMGLLTHVLNAKRDESVRDG